MRPGPAKWVTLVNGMRCPSCGTENAPDSRFCGGCGARIATSGQRVAPTQKISDDASFPPRRSAPTPAGRAVRVTPPGTAPPDSHAAAPAATPATAPDSGLRAVTPPPPGAFASPRTITPTPAAAPSRLPTGVAESEAARGIDPSLSMPIAARRPWALIVTVLLIDLGLGAAGVWMLSRGLDRPSAAPPSSAQPAALRPTTGTGVQVTPIEPAHTPPPAPPPAESK